MLTNKIDKSSVASSSQNQFVGGFSALFIFVMLVGIIFNTPWKTGGAQELDKTVDVIGRMLLNEYLLPFEIVSILLLASLMGAAMLSRRD